MSQVSDAKESALAAADAAHAISNTIHALRGQVEQVVQLGAQGMEGTATSAYKDLVDAIAQGNAALESALLSLSQAAASATQFAQSA